MSWSYDPTVRTNLNRVREKIGDTDDREKLLDNDIILEKLSDRSDSILYAAIDCVRLIIAQLARSIDQAPSGFSSNRSQRFEQYKQLLKDLLAEAASSAGNPNASATASLYFGGLTTQELEDVEADSESIQPAFKRWER